MESYESLGRILAYAVFSLTASSCLSKVVRARMRLLAGFGRSGNGSVSSAFVAVSPHVKIWAFGSGQVIWGSEVIWGVRLDRCEQAPGLLYPMPDGEYDKAGKSSAACSALGSCTRLSMLVRQNPRSLDFRSEISVIARTKCGQCSLKKGNCS